MKEITPPKLIPPDQSSAASGIFPTDGDEDADHAIFDEAKRSRRTGREKNRLPPGIRHDCHEKPGDKKSDRDFLPHHGDIHPESVGHGDPGTRVAKLGDESFLRLRRGAVVRVVRVPGMAAASRFGAVLVVTGLLDQSFRQGQAHEDPHDGNEEKGAHALREHEMPAEKNPEHEAEFQHQVGRGEHESQRGDEVRAFLESGAGGGGRRVGPTERRFAQPNCRVMLSCRTKTCRKADMPNPKASAQSVSHNMSTAA
jgi:hypothetical protein